MEELYDCKGYPIQPGDALRVFHFIGGRNRRFYMYKLVAEENGILYGVSLHEIVTKGWANAHKYQLRWNAENGCFLIDTEIIEGYGPGECMSWLDRKRVVVPKLEGVGYHE